MLSFINGGLRYGLLKCDESFKCITLLFKLIQAILSFGDDGIEGHVVKIGD